MRWQCLGAALIAAGAMMLLPPTWASQKPKPQATAPEQWEMSLEGGRTLSWEQSFNSEFEVKPNRGFWNKLVDVVAGSPDYRFLDRKSVV